ncbi:MAG TPA: hypothetical protein VHO25_03570, partial [Polyangiaceae bacterium]|nr:hypothetical protein [Polyangiaceae bacterium]
MTAIAESDALHQAVQAFGVKALTGGLSPNEQAAQFDALALRIAQYQAQHCEPVRRLLASHDLEVSSLHSVAQLPALPADAFRLSRVACHDAALDQAKYRTSGTTAQHTGEHCLRTVSTYRRLSTVLGRRALLGGAKHATVVALLPEPSQIPHSSLGAMCQFFMEEFDGRAFVDEAASFAQRWLVSDSGVDLARLRCATEVAAQRGEGLLVLATSLSLQLLLRDHPNERVPLPPNSAVMLTGGNKGRRESIEPEQLSQKLCTFFGIAPTQLIGEYGMTELSSQLYEGARWQPAAVPVSPVEPNPGVYFAPPWLQISAVDPISLRPVAEGEPGLARFVDLANIDSALVLVTRDLIRQEGNGIRLQGRQPHSPLRG